MMPCWMPTKLNVLADWFTSSRRWTTNQTRLPFETAEPVMYAERTVLPAPVGACSRMDLCARRLTRAAWIMSSWNGRRVRLIRLATLIHTRFPTHPILGGSRGRTFQDRGLGLLFQPYP